MPLTKLGPYKLEKILGRGGMGAVYAGLNEQTGERAAVKVLSGHLADDEAFRERFKIEVESLKRLLHPNIVQLFGYGEEEGHLFYVMELVEGRSLQDELTAGRRFTWREVARIGIAVAQALKHAHDRGIIHRDLKPANLLIDAQDHVKLTDFGIAKLYGGTNVTADGGVVGTADYMSPEQAEGKQVTSRCDLYALGSVLYALLTGRPPFAGRTIVQVMAALKNEAPTPIRRLAPDTPQAFEDIIGQLLEKDPQKRIPTALALANRLKAMEHALSLETQVGPLPEVDDEDLRIAPLESPPSASALPDTDVSVAQPLDPRGKTAPLPRSSSATKALKPPTGDGRGVSERAAGESPTIVEGGGVAPAGRTALGTQAGKPTGSDHAAGTAVPRVGGGTAAAELAQKASRFVTVSEAELRGEREADETSLKQWIAVGSLAAAAVVLIAVLIYWATRPPSADQLLSRISKAAEDGGAEGLTAVESDIERFLALYPADERAGDVRTHQQDLELYRLERSFERRARRAGGIEGLMPVERAYLEAVQKSATDPDAALAKFQALIDVYGGAPDDVLSPLDTRRRQQCLDLAERRIAQLKETVAQMNAEQRQAVRRQLERAAELAATDRAAAEPIWRGIITLYGDKVWAEDLVAEAEEKLAERR